MRRRVRWIGATALVVLALGTTGRAQTGRVLAGNSTTALLGGAGVYTGTFEDVTQAAAVIVTVKSDVASAANGVKVDWSSDCSNVDYTIATQTFSDTTNGQSFAYATSARCFRVVYTNAGGAQGTFRLQTIARDNLYASPAAAASTVDLTKVGGTAVSGANVVDAANTAFRVNCVTGCSAAGSFTDSTAFTFGGSTTTNIGAVVDDVGTNAVAENSAGVVRMSGQRILYADLSKTTANATALKVDGSAVNQPVWLTKAPKTSYSPLQASATANGNGTAVNVDGMATLSLDLACTTCSGGTTINFEAAGGDLNYVPVFATQIGTNTIATSTTQAGNSSWIVNVSGLSSARARISSYSAGTVTVDGIGYAIEMAPSVVNTNVISVPSNASTNVTQFGSSNVSTGTGTGGAGIPRVTVSSDSSLTANAGTNLNTSALALESGGNLATVAGAVRAEDAASADGHTGIGALAVRKLTPANTSGADGDYEFLQMSAGRLWASATIDAALPAGGNTIGAVTQASGPWTANVTQFGTNNVATGTGASGVGIPRVTVANDSNILATQSGTWNIGSVTSITNTVTAQGTLTNNNAAPSTNNLGALVAKATAAAPSYTEGNMVTLSTDNAGALRVSGSAGGGVAQTQVRDFNNAWQDVGYTNSNTQMPVYDKTVYLLLQQLIALQQQNTSYVRGSFGNRIGSVNDALKVYPTTPQDPCSGTTKGNVAISQTATSRLIPGQPGMRVFICTARVVAGAAEILNFTEGTGTTCGTAETAVSGSTTAANGESYAANGGFQSGSGAAVMITSKAGDDVCLKQSGSNRLSGNVTYAYVP